jgi:hypothetical protein
MKLDWRQIKFLGMTITLPLIVVIVQQLNAQQVEQFRRYKKDMAECPQCHRLFSGRAGNSFIMHLVDDHNVASFHAMDIVKDLYSKLLQRTADRRTVIETEAVN